MPVAALIVGGIVVLAIVVGLVLVFVYRPQNSGKDVQLRLEEYANRTDITLEELEMAQPFSERVLLPLVNTIATSITRFTPKEAIKKARHDLEMGGRPVRTPEMFFGIKGTMAIFLGIMGFIIGGFGGDSFLITVASGIGGAVLGFILPGVWLGSKIRARQEDIVKSLPDALDLLVICVEAGLGFEGAMAKVAEKWSNELANGFARVLQEVRLGKMRNEALREMEANMGVPDMTSFVAAIIQATQFGVSISKVLRIQSEQMRMKRRQRAEKKAQEAPIKMLFPMVFLIFPSLFIVLLGPAVLLMMDSGIMDAM